MWFTEDPWPPVMILTVLAIVFGIAWNATRRNLHFLLAAGFAALALVVLVAEEMIVTEAEVVEAQVIALAKDVSEENHARVLEYFSSDAGTLKSAIGNRIENVEVEGDLRITDLAVSLDETGNQALAHFRANGTVSYQSWTSTVATRWNVTWKKEAGTWKILKVEQLDPINGDVINTWTQF